MSPIAIWYHCRMSGGDPCINLDHATSIFQEQMAALKDSGLEAAATEIFIGVNGGDADHAAACMMAPDRAQVLNHKDGMSELPTIKALRDWLPSHPGWHVLYHHMKGAMYPGHGLWAHWRHCMAHHVVWNWKRCVADLERGYDAVGAHWITPEQYPALMATPYFGGNFWFANSSFLATRPAVMDNALKHTDRYEAEAWIGRGRRPNVMNYTNHWPGHGCPT